ncbi:hypothetical protein [Streptomyces antimicrobicus]|uniref:RING-type domain-containing protein n=1 Tax=Streptomyces antimicrobicus TaxID=2883108 RepID=A0ABS8B4K6_9ACTN|nr:hypothetical protein [Streptomyces antimicrobicus]MCB5179521.1 hypothetical protein [Streptomyces antimicrobicus]
MTTSAEWLKPKRRTSRALYPKPSVIEWMTENGTICGVCIDTRGIWCPDCCGFEGCAQCRWTYKVPCPACRGGTKEPIHRY